MNRLTWLRLPWLFNRRVGIALLWALVVLSAAFIVNFIGIGVTGSIEGWQNWLDAHATHFFVWRLCAYGAIACFWWRKRWHLRQRPFDAEAVIRLRLIGVTTIITVLLQEGSRLLQHG